MTKAQHKSQHSIQNATVTLEVNTSKLFHIHESPIQTSRTTPLTIISLLAGSMYDAANESVTLQLAELVSNSPTSQSLSVSSAGARLALPAAGVALSIPEAALSRGRREQIYVAVVKDDRYRPRLGKGWYTVFMFCEFSLSIFLWPIKKS